MPQALEMPDFLKESAEEIHNRMLKDAPKDINLVEGDIFWDATRPTAEEKAELTQMKLQNILRIAFPQTSYGQYLEFLGEMKGVFKLSPTKSTGIIKIYGAEDTLIEKGTVVGTIATDDRPSIEFTIDRTEQIGAEGYVETPATSVRTGVIGNVSKNTIIILNKSLNGVTSITNEVEFKNGTEIESEESFRERVLEAYRNEPLSGAKRDYIRWARQVDGVGNVYVRPEWNGAGSVKVLILDSNDNTANQNLIDKVQNHISPTPGKGERLAPIGATVTVVTPITVDINITADFILDNGFKKEDVVEKIKKDISTYLQMISIGGSVNYKAIEGILGSMIIKKEGILDYTSLLINNAKTNISLKDEIASMGTVTIL